MSDNQNKTDPLPYPKGTKVLKYIPGKGSLWGALKGPGDNGGYYIQYDSDSFFESISLDELNCVVAAAKGATMWGSNNASTTTTTTTRKGKDPPPKRKLQELSLEDTSDDDGTPVPTRSSCSIGTGRGKRISDHSKKSKKRCLDFWNKKDDHDEVSEMIPSLSIGVLAARRKSKSYNNNNNNNNNDFMNHLPSKDQIVDLTVEDQQTILAKITHHPNQALQKILFDTGCFRRTLLPHQFLAVRRVAGVPDNFPMHVGSLVIDAKVATLQLALAKVDLDSGKKRGILLADEMVRRK